MATTILQRTGPAHPGPRHRARNTRYGVLLLLILAAVFPKADAFAAHCKLPNTTTAACMGDKPQHPLLRDLVKTGTDSGICGCSPSGRLHCLPSLIVMGVEKGSTGEIRAWLSTHKQVNIVGQEMRYFNRGNSSEKLHEYLDMAGFCLSPEAIAKGGITAEKSPSYASSYCRSAPEIAATLPSVKLLLSLRNPVERAESAFYHHCSRRRLARSKSGMIAWDSKNEEKAERSVSCDSRGFDAFVRTARVHFQEDNATLEKFYAAVDDRTQGCLAASRYFKDNYAILTFGVYAVMIEEYFKHFDRSQLHILLADEFKEDPHLEMAKIEQWAGLETMQYRSHRRTEQGFMKVANARTARTRGANHGARDPYSPATRRILYDFYAPDIARLKRLMPELSAVMDKYWGWTKDIGPDSERPFTFPQDVVPLEESPPAFQPLTSAELSAGARRRGTRRMPRINIPQPNSEHPEPVVLGQGSQEDVQETAVSKSNIEGDPPQGQLSQQRIRRSRPVRLRRPFRRRVDVWAEREGERERNENLNPKPLI